MTNVLFKCSTEKSGHLIPISSISHTGILDKMEQKNLQSGRFRKEREFPRYQTKEGNLS